MTREEFKNMLYNQRFIAGGDYDNENPLVAMWLDDFVEITHEINNELIEKACEWLESNLDGYLVIEEDDNACYIHSNVYRHFMSAMKGD